MLTLLLPGLALLAFLFRKPLMARLAERLPDRTTRHRVVGAIIAAFVIMFGLRLLMRLIWG
jgi:ABC-type nickel/cobalt efflux system permease component RcnA